MQYAYIQYFSFKSTAADMKPTISFGLRQSPAQEG